MGQLLLRWFGVFYTAVGLLAFVFHDARGYEFGFLNVNTWHSTIHVLTGLVFIGASYVPRLVRPVAWIYTVLFALLIVFGMAPGVNPLEWWVPLEGTVLGFHVLTLIVLLAVAFTAPRAQTATSTL